MTKPRKLWSQLAPSTKARYKRYGVSPQTYNAGKISHEFRQTIFGKGRESFEVARAKQYGLDQIVTNYSKLRKSEREAMATAFLQGHTQRTRPIEYGSRGEFKIAERNLDQYLRDEDNNPIMVDTRETLKRANIEYENPNIGLPIENPKFGQTLINEDIVNAKLTLDEWFYRIGHGDMTREDWALFREAYRSSFTK